MIENNKDCTNLQSVLSSKIIDCLNQQILILEYIKKAKAKTQVALGDDFLDYDKEVICHYLWALSDRLEITVIMAEELVNHLSEIRDMSLEVKSVSVNG